MCVSVCERSLVEWVPVAGLDGKWSPAGSAGGANPRATGLQLPECRLRGWGEWGGGGEGRERAREGGTKAGSKRRRRGQSQAAPVTLGGEERRRGSLRGPSGFRRGRQQWLQQAGQKARLPGEAEALNLRGCRSPTSPPPPRRPSKGEVEEGRGSVSRGRGVPSLSSNALYLMPRPDFLRPLVSIQCANLETPDLLCWAAENRRIQSPSPRGLREAPLAGRA